MFWALWLRLIEIDEPWIGHHDFNGTWISLAASNYLKYGFLETGFGSTTNSGFVQDGNYSYYLHHPPLICWLVSIPFMAYGISEDSARIVSIFLSIGSIFMLFKICSSLFNYNVALISALIQTLLPMDAFFGRFVNHEPLILFISLVTIYLYLKWIKDKNYFLLLILSTLIGCLSGWSFYYMPALLFLHYQLIEKKSWRLTIIFILPIICIFCFLAFLLYIHILSGSIHGGDYGSIFEAFKVRISSKTIIEFTLGKFLLTEFNRILKLFTPVITFLALFYILTFITYPKLRIENHGVFLLMLMLFGIAHPLIFKQQAYVHDYLLFNLSPFMSISASVIIMEFSKILKEQFRIPVILIPILFFITYLNFSRQEILKLHEIRNLEEEYIVGLYIHNHTEPDDLIMTSFDKGSEELQLKYYSQRSIFSGVTSKFQMEKLIKERKGYFRFFIDSRNTDKSEILTKYLNDNYKRKFLSHYILYDFKKLANTNFANEEIGLKADNNTFESLINTDDRVNPTILPNFEKP